MGRMSKAKGGAFERQVATELSLWWSKGKRKDLFWRSSMSGGRATINKKLKSQTGDIACVGPQGHRLVKVFFIECKAYAKLDLDKFFFGYGRLFEFWKTASYEANRHNKLPMLVAKQNRTPPLLMLNDAGVRALELHTSIIPRAIFPKAHMFYWQHFLQHKGAVRALKVWCEERAHG